MDDPGGAHPRLRRVYLECTQTYRSGMNTGIERVVRSIVNAAADVGGSLGLDCRPVIYDECRHRFLQIDRLPVPTAHRVRGAARTPSPPKEAEAARVASGDVLLLLDSAWTVDYWREVEVARSRGAAVGVMYYDMLPLQRPDWFHDIVVTAFGRFWDRARATTSFITCISENTLAVAREIDSRSESLRPAFRPLQGLAFRLGAELDGLSQASPIRRELSRLLSADRPETYLAVGTVSPRKGYGTLLDAFDRCRAAGRDAQLIIAGGYGWSSSEIRDRLDSHELRGSRLHWFENLTDGELDVCYRNAAALITASHGEGFNLPIVEALSRGTTVLASDLPVHREVSGSHAAYFPDGDAVALCELMLRPDLRTAPAVAPPNAFRWADWKESCRELLSKSVALADRIAAEEDRRRAEDPRRTSGSPLGVPPSRMRIGIDMVAVQSATRDFGIGRYVRNFVRELVRNEDRFEFVLYQYDGDPPTAAPAGDHVWVQTLSGRVPRRAEIDRIARENPDGLDLLLVTSPFEAQHGYELPARPVGGVPVAAIVYDLIPLLFQEEYFPDRSRLGGYLKRCGKLAQYDLLLAISESARADVARHLGVSRDRVVSIGGAVDPEEFDRASPAAGAGSDLAALGITQPYVYSLAGYADKRKNVAGLIESFALLPEETRKAHQLVISCQLTASSRRALTELAAGHGVDDRLVLTGRVSDAQLRMLLTECAAFVFPSEYEGFGLPILEAMLCGAPVVAGNNSSQIEVVGDAGLLANVRDSRAVSSQMLRVLTDAGLAERLREAGPRQVRRFSWQRTAETAIGAIERIIAPRPPRRRRKPRLAVFSPLPPQQSGIADYTFSLAEGLTRHYDIDLFHAPGHPPSALFADTRFSCCDARSFPRRRDSVGYERILYQMGNSSFHDFVYDRLLSDPGVVTLHDYNLSGFHWRYAETRGGDDWLAREFAYCEGGRPRPRTPDECWNRGMPMNRRIFDAAEHVLVHSASVREWAVERHGAGPISVVPFGVAEDPVFADRAGVRLRHGLPPESFLICAFGILHPTKMNVEAIWAFVAIAARFPDAHLVFVGRELDNGEARRAAETLGPLGRVHFLGHLDLDAMNDLMSVADVALNLRRPPTNGESSACLQGLVRLGVPCVVTNTDTFAEYPDDAVRKIDYGPGFGSRLADVLARLVGSDDERRSVAAAALRHTENITWPHVADRYAEIIEEVVSRRRARGRYSPLRRAA